jgi:hypothetical protein
MLMFVFGKDIAAKSMIFFQQKAQMNMMLASIKEATMGMYAQSAPPPPPMPAERVQPDIIAVEPEEYEAQPKAQIKKRGRPTKI